MGNVKLILVYAIVVAYFAFLTDADAALTCSIKPACDSQEANPLKLSSIINAHAAQPSESNLPYQNFKVCCGGVSGLQASCAGPNKADLLRLSAATNAHVEKATLTNYPELICLSSPATVFLACDYSNDCASLGAEFACVASISSDTNAHVGNCNAYSTKICCSALSDYDFKFRPVGEQFRISATVGEQFELRVDINNLGILPDSYNVVFSSSASNLVDISNPSPSTGTVQPGEVIAVSTLIRPLADGDNTISITVKSNTRPSRSETTNLSMRIAKFTLPEFDTFGLLQIVLLATIVYFFAGKNITAK